MSYRFKVHKNNKSLKASEGFLVVLLLVYGAVFFMITSSLFGYIITQSKLMQHRVDIAQVAAIAEAGLDYYRWFLAHYPNDITNGTGGPGPYVHTYFDPEGGAIGEFSLEIESTAYCGDVAAIEVRSTGSLYANPNLSRTFSAQYSRPTVAEYAFLLNASVWAGSDRVISGPYHSNGGVRMDGTHNSVVTSGQTNWLCTSSFGCNPEVTQNGVFTTTANANPALFAFPSAPVNFAGLTVDLAVMKDRAQNQGGLYIAPSGDYGYRVTFNSDNTVTIHRVTNTQQYWGYATGDGWNQERHHITGSTFVGTYALSEDCPVVFVEDKVWLEGEVDKKVALAAADLINPGVEPSIILQGNITYTSATSSGLLAIAENNVLIGISVPDNMVLNGIFVAQNGQYGRNYYCQTTSQPSCNSTRQLPESLRPYNFRNSETLNGTIVSNGRVGTQWTSGGTSVSGFLNRYNSYDRNLAADPPPLTPYTSDVYQFSSWQDVR